MDSIYRTKYDIARDKLSQENFRHYQRLRETGWSHDKAINRAESGQIENTTAGTSNVANIENIRRASNE